MSNLTMVLCLYDTKTIHIASFVLNLPTHKHEDEIINTLFLFCLEQVYSLDQMYRLSADIGIPDTNSLTLEYRNGGDTMFLPVMVPRVPSVKYSGNLLHRHMGLPDGFSGLLRLLGQLPR